MKLYGYWRSSCSYRVRIALAYKGLPVTQVPVHLLEGGGQQHLPEFVRKNPMRQVPLLEVEDQGRTEWLGQSLAIIEYLEEKHPEPPLLPSGAIARARARQLAEVVNSGIQPFQNLSVQQEIARIAPGLSPSTFAAGYVARGLEALEGLARSTAGKFLVGDELSVADVCLVPQLYAARRLAVALAPFPTLLGVEQRCVELACFRQAHPDNQPDADRARDGKE